MLQANQPIFSQRECSVALELVEEGLARPDDEDAYQLVVCEDEGEVLGYVCFGTIPLTEGSFDLYWIVVHPKAQGRGIGRALMQHCEAAIARQGGRLVVVETSSRRDYDKTRRFYATTMGYDCAARFADFYAPGDDKMIFLKYLEYSGGRDLG
jgi:ribosomal protein S18 acetylase RimI-like enzyme